MTADAIAIALGLFFAVSLLLPLALVAAVIAAANACSRVYSVARRTRYRIAERRRRRLIVQRATAQVCGPARSGPAGHRVPRRWFPFAVLRRP
jgi:hypothetical protein